MENLENTLDGFSIQELESIVRITEDLIEKIDLGDKYE